jgi:hypothetical protein
LDGLHTFVVSDVDDLDFSFSFDWANMVNEKARNNRVMKLFFIKWIWNCSSKIILNLCYSLFLLGFYWVYACQFLCDLFNLFRYGLIEDYILSSYIIDYQ